MYGFPLVIAQERLVMSGGDGFSVREARIKAWAISQCGVSMNDSKFLNADRRISFRSMTWTLIALGICSAANVTRAQEIRLYTTIRDPARDQVLVRSLMLFHAGKVYDYIDSANEVTMFEPVHRRFTILNLRENKEKKCPL